MKTDLDETPMLSSVPNLRDVGGYPTTDGRLVKTGLLYRSGVLARLDGMDAEAFTDLGIRRIYDLRTGPERAEHPDLELLGVDYVVVDMMADVIDAIPARIEKAMRDPRLARDTFGEDRGIRLIRDHYREFVAVGSACRALSRVFGDLSDGGPQPVLVHCMGGKDRTGWAMAALLLLLGVPDDLVMQDYLLTNARLKTLSQFLATDFMSRGGQPELIEAVLKARPEFLEAALDEMRRRHGTVESYFAEGLGLGAGRIGALRRRFLD